MVLFNGEELMNPTIPSASSHQAVLSEVFGDVVGNLDQKLWDVFSATASTHPNREAIVSLWQSEDHRESTQESSSAAQSECLRWSYQDLRDKAEQLADALGKLGFGPGMHLAAVLWNCAEWGLLFWATARIGATFVPVDPRSPGDIEHILKSTKPWVLVVQDDEAAMALTHSVDGAPVRLHISNNKTEGWTSLYELLSPQYQNRISGCYGGTVENRHLLFCDVDQEPPALVVFTSGTTGQPKGCPHMHRNLVSETHEYDPNADQDFVDRWLVHTPVCHIFAINNALRAWKLGGAVVFASKSFNIDDTLKALIQEQCTFMSATPTLVKALLSHNEFPSPQKLNLSIVSIAGTMIEPEHIRLCREGLGAQDTIQAYGLSEGAPLVSWSRQDKMLVGGYHRGVGKVLPGAAVRVCRQDSHEVLPRSQIGELHVSGSSIISKYLGNMDEDKFYSDPSGRWLKTGDQAMMDEDSVIHILGRYKDLIIRGGENISLLKIELALSKIPDLQIHVVGVPDDIAGHVPVAIAKLPQHVTKAHILQTASLMGPQYALDAIYTLKELGIENIPATALGKPKKALLTEMVAKYRLLSSKLPIMENTKELQVVQNEDMLLEIWDQLIGVRPDKKTSVRLLADSITLLRYCDIVLRTCGKQLYLQDLTACDSIEKQAQLLVARDTQPAYTPNPHLNGHRDKYMKHHPSHHEHAAFTKVIKVIHEDLGDDWEAAQERINKLGLESSRVEEVVPIRKSLHRMVAGQRPQSYHTRVMFRIKTENQTQVYRGLFKALSVWPMMRAVLFEASRGHFYHAVVEPSIELFSKLIQDLEAETEEDAKVIYEDESAPANLSAFMFRASVIKISRPDSYILSLTYNHSVIDAHTLLPWHRDLDHLISDASSRITIPTSYKLFADLFHQYQDSLPAQKAVQFHVQRLRGISRCRDALWPKQRAPGMMIADDENSPYFNDRQVIRNQIWGGEWQRRATEFRFPRRSRVVSLPTLSKLHDICGLEPALFAKCALIIFNVIQTHSPYALFTTWESARSWPFIPDWIQTSLPPAMSIGGPTVEWVLNLFEVAKEEKLTKFFERMVHQQTQMHQHEHVPWEKVVYELREEGQLAVDASFRQAFVWDVSMGISASRNFLTDSDAKALDPVSQLNWRLDWPDCGLFWNAFMISESSLFFIASWDTAQMNAAEIDGHCDELAAVMRKLADEHNWDKSVGDVFGNMAL